MYFEKNYNYLTKFCISGKSQKPPLNDLTIFSQFLTFHFDEIFKQQFEYFSTQRRGKTIKKFVKMLWVLFFSFFFNKNWFKKIGNSGARWCKNQNLVDKNLWKYYPYYLRKFELLIFKAIISIQIFSIQSGHVHYPTIPIQPLWWTHVWNPNSKKLNWH